MRFNHFALFAVATLAFASCGSSVSIEERIEDTLSQMALEEKVAMVHAQSKFSSPGVPRLGIPEIWCTDGPHGIRTEVLWDEWVQPGESKVVRFTVKSEDLSFYSAEQHKWVAESGTFTAHLASGSDDMRESVTFELR